jgi:transcriptional regulator of aromatic amino acid metabolism
VDKGKLNVDVSDAIVVLRGEVKSPDRMRALENAVRRIPGVLDVRSLLHLPRTPAPNVRDALAASEAARRDAPR